MKSTVIDDPWLLCYYYRFRYKLSSMKRHSVYLIYPTRTSIYGLQPSLKLLHAVSSILLKQCQRSTAYYRVIVPPLTSLYVLCNSHLNT